MWRNTTPIDHITVKDFEDAFKFRINSDFRGFLMEHNGGSPGNGVFPTVTRERCLDHLLDFSDKTSNRGAWMINKRMREEIGPKRIVIGKDIQGNFVCLERNYQEQYVVVLSHISGDYERSVLEIPALLRAIF